MTGDFHRKNGRPCQLVVACILSIFSIAQASAFSSDDCLLAFAIQIHQTPMQSWGPGAGIYLGDGVVITAAHVAGHTWWTHPKVAFDGRQYATTTIKAGSFEGTDVTLLKIEQSQLPLRLGLRRMRLCTKPSSPGEEVVTIVTGSAVHSHVMSANKLPTSVQRFNTVIADVANTGNSGAGVFDVREGCLLGIMSRKISTRRSVDGRIATSDIAKYFVPAAEIAEFLPIDLHF